MTKKYAIYVVPDETFQYESISKGINWLGSHMTFSGFSTENKDGIKKFLRWYKKKSNETENNIPWKPSNDSLSASKTAIHFRSQNLMYLRSKLSKFNVHNLKKNWHITCSAGVPKGYNFDQTKFFLIMIELEGKKVTWLEETRTRLYNLNQTNKNKKKENRRKRKKKGKKVIKKKSLPMFNLKMKSGTLKKIKPFAGRWNALVITDCHFNYKDDSWFDISLIPQTILKIGKLIQLHGVDQLITLGDLFQSSCNSDEYTKHVVEQIAEFGAEMFMIGGNHDRGKTSRLKDNLSKKYATQIHIVTDYFMGCFPSNPNEDEVDVRTENRISQSKYPRVVFAHDAGNNYKLHGKQIEMFLRALKCEHQFFKPTDLLITGHTHENRWFHSEDMGSLSPFHMDQGKYLKYGLLKETESGGALKWKVMGNN
ncbi:transmembrane protein with metallophosphoesterase domain [Anaeramoeba flamelloides]|uniref:Transmembrane protein with metallophosphoesterase domain n=1 Tax=Anaeramoeba flamelloides TaxID=1746091 RepID=A0ABQ8XYE9_9EUKA|nr:transmembrane protein with metallophosphoesterase domain [Anaeramoeba flamelloides]